MHAINVSYAENMNASDLIIPIIVAAIASTPGILAILNQIRKDKRSEPIDEISAGVNVSTSAAAALESYSKEVLLLRGELSSLRVELGIVKVEQQKDKALIEEWRRGIDRLMAQFKSLDIKPVWTPGNGDK
jgi:hypothetical protein